MTPERITAVAAALALNLTFAAELEGVKFDDQIKVGASDLVINGTGVRSMLGKRYVAALYVTAKSGDAGSILSAKGSKRVALTLLKEGDGKTFAKAFGFPVFHVNAERPIECLAAGLLAMQRKTLWVALITHLKL